MRPPRPDDPRRTEAGRSGSVERAGRAGVFPGRWDRRDLIGLGLAGLTATWALVASIGGGSAGPIVALIVVATLAFSAARVVASIRPWIVPAALVALAAAAAASAGPDVLSRQPLSGPLGYANADAAFYVVAGVSAFVLVLALPGSGPKVLAGAIAVGCALVTISKDSTAASALLVLTTLGFAAGSRVSARTIVAGCAVGFALVLTATVVLAVLHRLDLGQGIVEPLAAGGLSERRVILWDEAMLLAVENPIAGVGPGRFASFSPTARADRDARWAHNEFLQQGAELGLAGFALSVGLFLWGFWRLGAVHNPDGVTAFGALALAAIGIQASIDYILHFPLVVIAVAALLGATTVDRDAPFALRADAREGQPAGRQEVWRR